MTRAEDLYTLSNLSKTYIPGCPPVLTIEKLQIPKNQIVVILGYSGSGKTTLLNLLGLLDEPDPLFGALRSGPAHLTRSPAGQPHIFFSGLKDRSEVIDLVGVGPEGRASVRSSLGFIFQQGHLLPNLPNVENVQVPLFINELEPQTDRISRMVARVGLHNDYERRLPSALSAGEGQRFSILRALSHDPTVILADEPTSNLDRDHAFHILTILAEWCRAGDGRTVIWVTHNIEQAATFAHSAIIMANGCVSDPIDMVQKKLEPETLATLITNFGLKTRPSQEQIQIIPSGLLDDLKHPVARNRFKNLCRFMSSFAVSDVFTPVDRRTAKGIIERLFGFRNTQLLSVASLLIVIFLSLFFGSIYFSLTGYLVHSVSDPRINSIFVLGTRTGPATLSKLDLEKLRGLRWARGPGNSDSFISWPDEIQKRDLVPGKPAIIAATGVRLRPLHCYQNPDRIESFYSTVTLQGVVLGVRDPILNKIFALNGSDVRDLQLTSRPVRSLFLRADKSRSALELTEIRDEDLDEAKFGIVLTKRELERDLNYEIVPQEIEVDLLSGRSKVPVLGVVEELPFSSSALILEGCYLKDFFSGASGDKTPGFDRISVYIQDMIKDGLPVSDALERMEYLVPEGKRNTLSWIKGLTEYIMYFSLVTAFGIVLIVVCTLVVFYTQAIQQKGKEIGVLLAYGIRRSVLYMIFILEILIVWCVAVAIAVPIHWWVFRALRGFMVAAFRLSPQEASILTIPRSALVIILAGSLILGVICVAVAVRRFLKTGVATILRGTQ